MPNALLVPIEASLDAYRCSMRYTVKGQVLLLACRLIYKEVDFNCTNDAANGHDAPQKVAMTRQSSRQLQASESESTLGLQYLHDEACWMIPP